MPRSVSRRNTSGQIGPISDASAQGSPAPKAMCSLSSQSGSLTYGQCGFRRSGRSLNLLQSRSPASYGLAATSLAICANAMCDVSFRFLYDEPADKIRRDPICRPSDEEGWRCMALERQREWQGDRPRSSVHVVYDQLKTG